MQYLQEEQSSVELREKPAMEFFSAQFVFASELARSRTDAHADGSTFVSRKATISWLAANPTWTSFANALKAYGNHRITFPGRPFGVMPAISFNDGQISFNDGRISLYVGQISFNDGTHTLSNSNAIKFAFKKRE